MSANFRFCFNNELNFLWEFIRGNTWLACNYRIIGLGKPPHSQHFEKKISLGSISSFYSHLQNFNKPDRILAMDFEMIALYIECIVL